jgi:hypothetical protein
MVLPTPVADSVTVYSGRGQDEHCIYSSVTELLASSCDPNGRELEKSETSFVSTNPAPKQLSVSTSKLSKNQTMKTPNLAG